MTTTLQPDECLEEIQWPVWREPKTGSAFTEISRRHGDFAMVAAAAQVAVDDEGHCTRATFGVGGAAPAPVAFPELARRLVGNRLDKAVLRDVAHEAAAALEPGSDTHASADYRRHLAGVLTTRVLQSRLRHREGGAMSETLYPIAVEVNGVKRTGQVTARTSLVDWLREHLHLTGTHIGCEHGICGACSVMLDGAPVRSCLMYAVQADGHRDHHGRGPGRGRTDA